jgi:hypothetical protein
MMNRKTFLSALALGALLAANLPAADKPNFSGTWKLNSGKSDFGMAPAPDKMDRVIVHSDPTLKVTTTQSGAQGEATTDETLTTDGKDSINKVRGVDMKSVASWDGPKLVVKSKRDFNGMELSITQNWTLSADGKVLTLANNISTPQGDFEMKIVMDKVDGGPAPAVSAKMAPSAIGGAGCKSDFSGNWKLNVDKSNFGPVPPPTSMTLQVDHKDPVLKTVTNQNGMDGEYTINATYTTDGKESKNDFRGVPASSTAKCDGAAMLVNTKLEVQGMAIEIKANWQLSADGKVMNQVAKIATPQGDFDLTQVLERVSPK